MSDKRSYFYSVYEASPGKWGLIRTREGNRSEMAFSQSAGGLTFVRWETWVPEDFQLATYEYGIALGFAEGMNAGAKVTA